MSDETPQKGWDTWFSMQPDSPGDEPRVPEQAPEQPDSAQSTQSDSAQPDSARETQVAGPRGKDARASADGNASVSGGAPVPAPAAAPESKSVTRSMPGPEPGPESGPESASVSHSVPRAPSENEAEQTNWTVPSLGAVLEGRDAQQQTQVTRPSSSGGSAPSRSYSSSSASSPSSAPSSAPAEAPQEPARGRSHRYGQGQGQGSSQGQGPNPDQAATQYSAQIPGQYPSPEQTAAPRPSTAFPAEPAPFSASAEPAASAPEPAATTSHAAPAAPAAPSWQPPQPAQMWSAAPRPTAFAYPQPGAGGQPPQGTAGDDEWADWEEPERRRPSPEPAAAGGGAGSGGRPRSRKKFALAGGIGAAAVIGLVAVLVINQGGSGAGAAAAKPSGFQPTGTTVAGDAEETATAFLAAWQLGNFQQAADYTDDPAAALSALTAYKNGLNLAGLKLTTQNVVATDTATNTATAAASAGASGAAASTESGTVSFAVAAKVGLPAAGTASSGASTTASASSSADTSTSSTTATSTSEVTASWSYSSKLTAYKRNGGWWIGWAPALVAPNLTAGEKVVSFAVPPTASEVTDASGNDLSDATDAGVKNIAAALKKSAPTGQGTPGVQIELEGADGTPIANTADTLLQPVATGVVKTTIDPNAEQAAQTAVDKYTDSSMVVLKPSTGEILAVANNDGQNDFALTARVAPGSTNKIITSTALLANNYVSSTSQAVECPKSITVNGTAFANSQGESEPADTPFLTDFAASCNNAFGQWYDKIGSTTLAQTAEKYYGLNEQWNIGLGAAGPYYTIPSSASNGELFQELFGQGQLEASPLAMASVAATVDTGTFKQPIVVPGAAQLSATSLPSNVKDDLHAMMKAVTTDSDGTAYQIFAGVSSQVYGKTGTADVGDGGTKQQNPNSWMVVFDPTLDIAIGCVVLNAGYGASFAGPETAAVLKALQ